jgi:hypothetical protein
MGSGHHQDARGRRRRREPSTVVDGTGALIPVVEMAADEDDTGSRIMARNFGHDVARG